MFSFLQPVLQEVTNIKQHNLQTTKTQIIEDIAVNQVSLLDLSFPSLSPDISNNTAQTKVDLDSALLLPIDSSSPLPQFNSISAVMENKDGGAAAPNRASSDTTGTNTLEPVNGEDF